MTSFFHCAPSCIECPLVSWAHFTLQPFCLSRETFVSGIALLLFLWVSHIIILGGVSLQMGIHIHPDWKEGWRHGIDKSHIHFGGKFLRGIFWDKDSHFNISSCSSGFQCGEEKYPHLLAAKLNGDEFSRRNSRVPGSFSLRNHTQTHSYSIHLNDCTRVAAWKASVTKRKKWSDWYQVKCWETAYSHTESLTKSIVPLSIHPYTRPLSQHVTAMSETPSTMIKLFDLPWSFPKATYHPMYRFTQGVNSGFSI